MSDHIDTLKKLHTRLIDSRDGYRESRKEVSDEAAFVGFFDQRIAEREKFHTELHRQLGADGVDVSEEGSVAACAGHHREQEDSENRAVEKRSETVHHLNQ